jgi:hypothetical protein
MEWFNADCGEKMSPWTSMKNIIHATDEVSSYLRKMSLHRNTSWIMRAQGVNLDFNTGSVDLILVEYYSSSSARLYTSKSLLILVIVIPTCLLFGPTLSGSQRPQKPTVRTRNHPR